MSSIKTVCARDCYDACFMKVLLDGDNKPFKIVGNKDNPVTQGFLCPHGVMDIKRTHSSERILYPYRHVGDKPNGSFERISWDDALNLLVEKLRYALEQFGSDSVLHLDYNGNMGLFTLHLPQRLFYALAKQI
ncbi:MAG: molybdopterin-dependent oxidoreductase [Candidatus Bathyarchaeia archaeon]|nr:molybdopterin-dependent oxidoreductase [Candidatus Bathyarchaeia archaeon]